jgi:glycosyltransferase involved in cell wall biosynthesis
MTDARERTILVLAYSISPVRGSEYAVGWNYVTQLAGRHKLVVLYGLAGDHMGDAQEIADYRGTGAGGTEFVFVPPGRIARAINSLNVRGILPFSFYLAYRFWHRTAARRAAAIVAARPVDVIHYLCPIGYREPGYLWQLDTPYVWGPIGGMNMRPLRPFAYYGWKTVAKTLGRNIANWLQFRLNPRLGRAIRHTDVLIANTSENAALVERVYGRRPLLMPENAITAVADRPHARQDRPLAMIWVGRIDAAKALEILIVALGALRDAPWTLEVVGDGVRAAPARALAHELGLAHRIRWSGVLPRAAVAERFAAADVHVLTSLAEAHSTVLWEAMSLGVPTIAFDHCGMHDSICDACGIRVPLGDFDAMAAHLADAIRPLLGDRDEVARLSQGALRCAKANGWDARVERLEAIYDQAITQHAARKALAA